MTRLAKLQPAASPDSLLDRLAAGAVVADRLALVAAHPDDETLGLGGRLDRM
ncbi:PIG-L family deacetylase, partial [Caulobacter sp. 17J65-9]|nr:PIG-L family deacetylase [Caulobacter sp. 17J65-9]